MPLRPAAFGGAFKKSQGQHGGPGGGLQALASGILRVAAFNTAWTTRSSAIPVMQRKSMGHRRRKHGEQGARADSNWWRASPGAPGPVNSGEVLPKGTTTGV